MADPSPSPSPPESPPPAPLPASSPAAEHAEAEAAVRGQTRAGLDTLRGDVEKFVAFVHEDKTDFAGKENLEENHAYLTIKNALESLFKEANQIGAPENMQAAWRAAMLAFVKERVKSADEVFASVTSEEAEEIVTAMRDLTKGVGDFELWVKKSPYAAEYEKWKQEKAAEEKKRQEAERAAQEAAEKQRQTEEAERQRQEQASLEATEEADAPFLDKLNHTVAQMEEGKWKTVATKLVAALTGLFVMLSKALLIGGWVRKNFISNKMLARLGDKNAEVAVRAEGEFRKFGLTGALANELGGKKTKDVVALINDPQKLANLTTDTAMQQKLAHLAGELTKKGGATSEVILFEFMGNNPAWTGIQYSATAVAEAAGGSAAPAAPATGAGRPTAAPAETPQSKLDTIFSGMSADDRKALEDAKAKDVASGTLPDRLKSDERAVKIAAKLKANGADQISDPNQTVEQFVEGNLDKDWTIA